MTTENEKKAEKLAKILAVFASNLRDAGKEEEANTLDEARYVVIDENYYYGEE